MTASEIKELFRCSDAKCGFKKPISDQFDMLHAIESIISRMTPEQLDAAAEIVTTLTRPFDLMTLSMYAEAGHDYHKCRAVMTTVTIAAFSMLNELAETFAAANFQKTKAEQCRELIQ